jgi:D-glycero-alpha-D-manno-heptose-7-phosphate kinase
MQASLLVCYTGQSRTSHTIIADQVSNLVQEDMAAMAGMHQLKADAFEMKMALFRSDFDAFGALLSRSWLAKKATSSNVTNARIEELWCVARDAGALSGKVSGAGGGGFLMFVCEPERRSVVLRRLREAGGEPDTVAFSAEGVEGWGVR